MSYNTDERRRPLHSMPATSTRRQRIPARALGAYIPKLTRKAFEKYGFSAAALLTDWAMIVGEEIAHFAVPERLRWPRNVAIREDVEAGAEGRPGATLLIRVEPARALDVQYQARQILERINGYFGYRAVAELRILQAPLDKTAAPPQTRPRPPSPGEAPELSGITDERLRAALARLKSGLLSRAPAGV